jgi:hypothetical protein
MEMPFSSSQGFSESDQTEVHIRGPLESSAVEELLCHAKGMELHLSEENVFSILEASGMLQFEDARKSCCNFLKVFTTNIFSLYFNKTGFRPVS